MGTTGKEPNGVIPVITTFKAVNFMQPSIQDGFPRPLIVMCLSKQLCLWNVKEKLTIHYELFLGSESRVTVLWVTCSQRVT